MAPGRQAKADGPRETEAKADGPRETEAKADGPRETEAKADGPQETEAKADGLRRYRGQGGWLRPAPSPSSLPLGLPVETGATSVLYLLLERQPHPKDALPRGQAGLGVN